MKPDGARYGLCRGTGLAPYGHRCQVCGSLQSYEESREELRTPAIPHDRLGIGWAPKRSCPLMAEFELSRPERHFLSHWMHDACADFWGPSIIWCWNNRIDWNKAPYPMAVQFSQEEVAAGRLGWFFERPQAPFEVPWSSVDEFWERASAALALIPHLQGGNGFEPACLLTKVRGTLTQIVQPRFCKFGA